MRSTDVSVSRVSISRIHHVLPDRLLICFHSRFTCFLTCTNMDCRLVYAYHFTLRFPLLTRRLVWRVIIPVHCLHLLVTTICTCIYSPGIYTIEDAGLFPIFNLLCNHPTSVKCEIPRTLRLPSSSLAKATASRLLGVRLLCLLAYR